jgi:ribosomal protein S18 acetylase RimI-like enzyme
MRIEVADVMDAGRVMLLISACVRHMRANGIVQWDDLYPNLQVVEADARSGSLFVGRQENDFVAAVCLNEFQPDEYRCLQWHCATDRPLVVHRLCVHPDWQHRGVARQLMAFAERRAREHRYDCIRLDTYTGNPRALEFYQRLGYRRIGQTHFPRRPLPYDCFEKVIGQST